MHIGISSNPTPTITRIYSTLKNGFHSLRNIKCGANAKAGTNNAIGPLVSIPPAIAMVAINKDRFRLL